MPSYTTPVIIGTSQDFGTNPSLVTEAVHTIPGSSGAIGTRIADGIYPQADYANFTALQVYTSSDNHYPWEFASIQVGSNMQSPAIVYYGIKIDAPAVSSGTGFNQYGLFIENQTAASNCYAIYTNAGAIRFGALAGSGNRAVMVTSGGQLYA